MKNKKQIIGAVAGWLTLATICGGGLTYCNSCISEGQRREKERFDKIKPSLETIKILGVDARLLKDSNNPNIQYVDIPPYRDLDFVVENVDGRKVSRAGFSFKLEDNYNFHKIRQKAVREGLVDKDDIYADN